MFLTPQCTVGHGGKMPRKKDGRHNNPGRPKLKESEKQSIEVKTRVRPDTDQKVRAAAEKAGLVPYQWLRRALEVMVDDDELLGRVEKLSDEN
jgi:hypothetical protein